MASLECLDCCVADVEGSAIWKLVLVSLLLVRHLRVVLIKVLMSQKKIFDF